MKRAVPSRLAFAVAANDAADVARHADVAADMAAPAATLALARAHCSPPDRSRGIDAGSMPIAIGPRSQLFTNGFLYRCNRGGGGTPVAM